MIASGPALQIRVYTRLPFCEKRTIINGKSGRLFGKTDVKRRAVNKARHESEISANMTNPLWMLQVSDWQNSNNLTTSKWRPTITRAHLQVRNLNYAKQKFCQFRHQILPKDSRRTHGSPNNAPRRPGW